MKDVVSKDVAEKLQKAGYNIHCPFQWVVHKKTGEARIERYKGILGAGEDEYVVLIPAPTATELAEALPKRLEMGEPEHGPYRLIIECQDTRYLVTYICVQCKGKFNEIYSENLPDALGLTMIFLLENNLLPQGGKK